MASTRTYGGLGTPVDEQSLGELFATFSRDMSLLVHQEIELAKSEIAESTKKAGIGGGLLGGAGVFALWGLFLMTFAAGFGIAAGANLSIWAGFLIDGGVFLVVAGVLAAIGGRSLKKISGPAKTKATVQAGIATLKGKRGAKAA
jgi:hypothetical protein